MRKLYISLYLLSILVTQAFSQAYKPLQAADILLQMQKLNTLGTVLYFAAHPDDENTKLIAYLASERKVRTAYLSLTRGDGGQNLIGTEQGAELGLIRTQELLQARKIDQGEQYFTAAYDFGFSKTHSETFAFWNKQEVLREAVWIIRKLQPDIIITRFPPDERGGHGHHQASAMLAKEAYIAAADKNIFPEQLSEVAPWQAKRLIWNTGSFMHMPENGPPLLKIDIGQFNTLLGQSYGELSAVSRSQHKSQGFGAAVTNGQTIESFEHVSGSQAQNDIFDGVNLSWSRVKGAEKIAKSVDELIAKYKPEAPQQSIPGLVNIWKSIQHLDNAYWKEKKSKELENLILACAGIHIGAWVEKPYYTQGASIPFKTAVVLRNPNVKLSLLEVNQQATNLALAYNTSASFDSHYQAQNTTQPFWLAKPFSLGKFAIEDKDFGQASNQDLPSAKVLLGIEGIKIPLVLPLKYKYVDPVRGEVQEYVQVRPNLTAVAAQSSLLIGLGQTRTVSVQFQQQAGLTQQATIVANIAAAGWKVSPSHVSLNFDKDKSLLTQEFEIQNISASDAAASLVFTAEGHPLQGIREIAYSHIPTQAWFPPAAVKLQGVDLINPVKQVAYIMGAGDRVPEALKALGMQVDIIKTEDITAALLSKYEAVVFGVRIMNVDKNIAQKLPIVYAYVENGGVALMQYNVNTALKLADFGPKPLSITRARVTEEDALVHFINPEDPALNYPNKISAKDFDNWVQERGLYFAEQIDPSYRTPLSMHDKNEKAHNGSLLINNYGKGKFIYTSLSFFRQLPAGVPGASRLFVNLLTKEK